MARLEPAAAAAMAEQVFGLLRKALDARREARFGDSADVAAVERAAAAALVATTMKLKDNRFKPLFLGLLEWSLRPPPGTPFCLASQRAARLTRTASRTLPFRVCYWLACLVLWRHALG